MTLEPSSSRRGRGTPALARRSAFLVAALLLSSLTHGGCATNDTTAATDAAAPSDAASANGDAARSGAGFTTRETLRDDATALVERVRYDVGGISVEGELCRPKGAGPFPVVLWSHGGIDGLGGEWNGGLCLDAAKNGLAFVASAYRGEDRSGGALEFCGGEVDDSITMLDLALGEPWADRAHVVAAGVSHGACVTLHAAARGAPLLAAVAVVPPSHLDELVMTLTAGDGAKLRARVVPAIGGEPSAVPAAYAARDVKNVLPSLEAFPGALMIIVATDDELIPVALGCKLATEAKGFSNHHVVAADGTTSALAPEACAGVGAPTFESSPRPSPTWPGSRYFMFYDHLGHGFQNGFGPVATADWATFLARHLPPNQ